MPDLYVAPGLDYVPVEGEVVLIEYLPSGRPLLVVELRNDHRIRAILTNDDIHSDTVPPIGSFVECVQHQGVWSYVRTLDVLQGRAAIGVSGAGLVTANQQATIYGTPDRFVGMSSGQIVLNGSANQLIIRTNDLEITGTSAGAKYDDKIRLTGGRAHLESDPVYHLVAGRPNMDLAITSEASSASDTGSSGGVTHTHDMDHTHVVDIRTQLRMVDLIEIDDALVGPAITVEPMPVPNPMVGAAPAAPVASGIADDFDDNQRTYSWSAVAGAEWYNVRWLYKLISGSAAIASALGGSFGALSLGLLATTVAGTTLTIPIALRRDFFDAERNIGRTRAVGSLVVSDFENVSVRQIEVVGFQAQAQVALPMFPPRPTAWSSPYYVYYVDWER